LLFTYVAGTTTPQATWVDSTQTTQNTNPVVLNSRGEANVWLDPRLTYKFVLQDSAASPIWTVDQIPGNGTGGSQGSFAATTTGFTVVLTPTIQWVLQGPIVTLVLPLITGTSNAAIFNIAGLPAFLQPLHTQICSVATIQNNGVNTAGGYAAMIPGNSSIGISFPAVNWTASGTKSCQGTVTYSLT
jgi:hypothetical protein